MYACLLLCDCVSHMAGLSYALVHWGLLMLWVAMGKQNHSSKKTSVLHRSAFKHGDGMEHNAKQVFRQIWHMHINHVKSTKSQSVNVILQAEHTAISYKHPLWRAALAAMAFPFRVATLSAVTPCMSWGLIWQERQTDCSAIHPLSSDSHIVWSPPGTFNRHMCKNWIGYSWILWQNIDFVECNRFPEKHAGTTRHAPICVGFGTN